MTNSTNPVYQNVQIALNESGVQIAALRSQIAQIDSKVSQLNDQIDTMPEVEAKYAELTRDYSKYQSLYDELLMQKERERMGQVGDERDVVSFNVIEPPMVSIDPVAPKRTLFLIGVLLAGIGAAGAFAFVLHQLNPVFHDARTLREISGRPVLGVVSMTWLDRHRMARRISFSSFAMVGVGLFVVFVLTVLFKDEGVLVMNMLVSQPAT